MAQLSDTRRHHVHLTFIFLTQYTRIRGTTHVADTIHYLQTLSMVQSMTKIVEQSMFRAKYLIQIENAPFCYYLYETQKSRYQIILWLFL